MSNLVLGVGCSLWLSPYIGLGVAACWAYTVRFRLECLVNFMIIILSYHTFKQEEIA